MANLIIANILGQGEYGFYASLLVVASFLSTVAVAFLENASLHHLTHQDEPADLKGFVGGAIAVIAGAYCLITIAALLGQNVFPGTLIAALRRADVWAMTVATIMATITRASLIALGEQLYAGKSQLYVNLIYPLFAVMGAVWGGVHGLILGVALHTSLWAVINGFGLSVYWSNSKRSGPLRPMVRSLLRTFVRSVAVGLPSSAGTLAATQILVNSPLGTRTMAEWSLSSQLRSPILALAAAVTVSRVNVVLRAIRTGDHSVAFKELSYCASTCSRYAAFAALFALPLGLLALKILHWLTPRAVGIMLLSILCALPLASNNNRSRLSQALSMYRQEVLSTIIWVIAWVALALIGVHGFGGLGFAAAFLVSVCIQGAAQRSLLRGTALDIRNPEITATPSVRP